MAETTDELRLVEGVCSHFHATHGLHLLVHGQEVMAGDLYLEVGRFALVGVERVLMKTNSEGLGWVGRGVFELGSVGRSLDGAQTELGLVKCQNTTGIIKKQKTYSTKKNTRASQRSHMSRRTKKPALTRRIP